MIKVSAGYDKVTEFFDESGRYFGAGTLPDLCEILRRKQIGEYSLCELAYSPRFTSYAL